MNQLQKNKILIVFVSVIVILPGVLAADEVNSATAKKAASAPLAEDKGVLLSDVRFEIADAEGIGNTPGLLRRDPSDIIKVDDKYYIWYSRAERGAALYPSGYGAVVWYATSTDEGRTWTEQGQAVGLSESGEDSHGCFTPNILVFQNKYYLYYTAVEKGFKNQGYTEIGKTHICVSVADSLDGPWTKGGKDGVVKVVLTPSKDHSKFDSYRVDDSCMFVRDGKVWMYYKGRKWQGTPGQTKMGLAIADGPLGPFVRQNNGDPVQPEGHEVLCWAYRNGVVSLVSNVGRGIYFSEDGKQFSKILKDFKGKPNAPGAFRPELTDPAYQDGVRWGISMVHTHEPYLVRWEATGLWGWVSCYQSK